MHHRDRTHTDATDLIEVGTEGGTTLTGGTEETDRREALGTVVEGEVAEETTIQPTGRRLRRAVPTLLPRKWTSRNT